MSAGAGALTIWLPRIFRARAPATTCTPFECNMTPADSLARALGDTMTSVKLHASTILTALGDVQSALVGRAVVLTDGKAGTVESIWLDELHGLRISIRGHDGRWPISTIKMQQGTENHSGPI
jgi:hypothetical protein